MEMRQFAAKNVNKASYNRFNSCEDNDEQDEDNVASQSFMNITSGGNSSRIRCYRLAAVCLIVLCVLLISAVSVLWVKFNNLTTKNNDLQTRYSNLILEKDQLQTSYKNVTIERDQLYQNLNVDKDQLQTSYNNMTVERDRLQTSYNNMTVERDRLQTSYNKLIAERDRLQTSYNNMTVERDRLETSYTNLMVERDRLQTSYTNMTVERDRLQTSYTNMTVERDRLQTSYNNMAVERDRLQTLYNNLTVVRDQAKCAELVNEMEKLQTNYTTMENQKNQLQKEKDEIQNMLTKLFDHIQQGWLYFNSTFFFISTERKSWNDSRQECRNKGGDLVIIKTKEEQEFLVQQLGNDKAWIGLNDRVTEGTWKWVDGTVLTTQYWAPGEPNNVGNEDCAEIWGFQGKQGWNDMPCGGKVKWICGKPASQ